MTAPSEPQILSQAATEVVRRLRMAGFESYWAGGCVRDYIMGRIPKDYDVATAATPDQVETLFPDSRAFGKAFGVVQVRNGDFTFEVATFRKDIGYSDGRRPDRVEFSSAENDAQRRDFTINGLFYDPIEEKVIDFVDGQRDIARRVVRAIGDPGARFSEDYLRMLRAVRFATTLSFDLDPSTAAAVRTNAGKIAQITPERIQQELTRLLTETPAPGAGVRMLDEVGLLAVILPEVAQMKGVRQPPQFHPEGDVFVHTLLMLDALSAHTPELVYSVLFHDIGKPPTFRITREAGGTDRIRFDGHDRVGAEMTERIMRRLRFSNEMIETVTRCVLNHMRFISVPHMRESTLRRMVGAPDFDVELELHRVDCLSSHGDLSNFQSLTQFREKIRNEPVLPPALISGHDIMALGVPEGQMVGVWRKRAYDAQLEGRYDSRESGLEWLRSALAQEADAGADSN